MLEKRVISMMLIFSLFFVMFSNCNLHIANAGTKDTDTVQEGKDTTLSEELSMKFITSNYILASDGTVWSIEGEKVLENIKEVKVYKEGSQDVAYYLDKFGRLYVTGYSYDLKNLYSNITKEHAFSKYGFQKDIAHFLLADVKEFGLGYAIKEDGSLYVWGSLAGHSSLLVSTQYSTNPPTECKGISNVKKMLYYGDVYIVLKEDGTVWTLGTNYYALIGNGKQSDASTGGVRRFYQVPISKVTDICFAGGTKNFVCALTEDNTLYGWGTYREETGDTSYKYAKSPTVLYTDVDSIVEDYNQVVAIDKLGNAYDLNEKGIMDKKKIAELDNMQTLHKSSNVYLALKKSKGLWIWGASKYGCLGTGKTEQIEPEKVMSDVEKLYYSVDVVAAINTKKELYCWGACGFNYSKYKYQINEPVKIDDNVLDLYLSSDTSYYVNASGYVYTWGDLYDDKGESANSNGDLVCLNPDSPITIGDRYTVHVVEKETQEGIAGIVVDINGTTLVTDKDGYASVMGFKYKYGYKLEINVNNNAYASEVGYDSVSKVEEYSKNNNAIKVELNAQDTLSLGITNLNFTMPEQIPLLGGLQTKLSFFDDNTNLEGRDSVPFKLNYNPVSKKYYAFIGCDSFMKKYYDIKKPEDMWGKIKNIKDKNSFRRVILPVFAENDDFAENSTLNNGLGKFINGGAFGYVEGTKKYLKGEMSVFYEGRYGGEVNVYPGGVPILLRLDVGAKGTLTGTIQQTADNNLKGYLTASIQAPDLMMSAGVGLRRVCDVSVYGRAYNTINYKIGSSITGEFGGQAGLSYKLLMFSGKYPIVDHTYNYTIKDDTKKVKSQSLKGITNKEKESECELKIDRSYLKEQSEWGGKETKNKVQSFSLKTISTGTEHADVTTLQKNIYEDAKPKLITTENGTKMLVYTADLGDRSTGNNTEVVYSLYNEKTKNWSAPKVVEDDGTADFMPAVATDGKDIYITWVNATKKFDKDVDYMEMAKKCDIVVAKYNTENDTFEESENISKGEQISGGDTSELADMMPSIAVKDGNAYVVWWANSKNDLFGADDTSTDYIICADNASGKWKTKEYTSNTKNEIKTVAIGLLGNEIYVAYSAGTDGKMETFTDVELFAGSYTGKATKVTDNEATEDVFSFEKIGGKNVLTFYSDDTISYTTNLTSIKKIVSDVATSEYTVVSGDTKDALMYVHANGNGSDINTVLLENGEVSGDIPVTYLDGYISSVSGYLEDDTYKLAFTRTDAVVSDTVEESVDLCIANIAQVDDLSITDVSWDETDCTTELPVSITLKNNGFNKVSKYTVAVEVDDAMVYNEIQSDAIEVGKDVTLSIKVPFENGIKGKKEMKITVVPSSEQDSNKLDNVYSCEIGKPDLSIKVNEVPESAYINPLDVIIENSGNTSATATLHVFSSADPEKELKSYSVGEIASGKSTTYQISSKDVAAFCDKEDSLIITVEADKEELFDTNNNAYFYYETPLYNFIHDNQMTKALISEPSQEYLILL